MISHKLEHILNEAIKKANGLMHEYLTLEGVLFILLDDALVFDVLQSCGADIVEIRNELDDFLSDEGNFSILSEDEVENLGKKQFADERVRDIAGDNGIKYQPELTLSLQRVLQRAALHVQSSGKQSILGIHVLVAMFGEKESFALYLIEKYGINRFDVVKKISHSSDLPLNESSDTLGVDGDVHGIKPGSALENFTTNLNQEVRDGKIDPIIGREEEIKRISRILCRRQNNNPLLVGDVGVGKTAVAHGVAWAVEHNEIPERLKNIQVYSLDIVALLAGARYRGDFEGRFKEILKELSAQVDDGTDVILFIDELHTVMGAGATSGGSLDASAMLRPVLSSGKIRCMGSTTNEEYRKFIERDHAFARRFQMVEIGEPTERETMQILQGLRTRYEDHHNVKFSNTVLKTAITLSEKYLTDRRLPDKVIDVIDEAGALIQLMPESKRRSSVLVKDIETIVSFLAKVPEVSVKSSERDKLKNLKTNLKLLIFGQDEAICKVSDTILLSRSGLGSAEKPIASFLFTGPTGVGKTELARQLAFNLGINFERFDMSEYMEKHSVSKLIGAPPGYVGHDQGGGRLTDSVKKNPHTLVLLDEIEKAHADIFNILLQIMDHGVLTDSHGRGTNFRNVILVMTTNAGAKDMDSGSISIGSDTLRDVGAKRDKAIKNFFMPEFRNRLDGIIHFGVLSDEIIVMVARKFMMELEVQLTDRKIELQVSDEVYHWLAKTGFDAKMGARPIARLIDNEIKHRLSNEILFGELEKGGKVSIELDNGKIQFIFSR